MSIKKSFFRAALDAIERADALLPPAPRRIDWSSTIVGRWTRERGAGRIESLPRPPAVTLDDLIGVDEQKRRVDRNVRQFLAGLPANDVLLWGPRGTGKSSLIKAAIATYSASGLRAVEVDRLDLADLPAIVAAIADTHYRFIVFCDDLSFEARDSSYKALKTVLDGGLYERPENILVCATSNRRHLVPETASDNEGTRVVETELHYTEAVEEKISLSDRFGLWLSFHPFNQKTYLEIVAHWLAHFGLELDDESRTEALRFALERGSRSGRTGFQFARERAGQLGLERREPG